jgi:hypothetical protein
MTQSKPKREGQIDIIGWLFAAFVVVVTAIAILHCRTNSGSFATLRNPPQSGRFAVNPESPRRVGKDHCKARQSGKGIHGIIATHGSYSFDRRR